MSERIKKNVLIIEDEIALLDSYSEVLTNEGLTPIKCIDGYKGLEVLKKNHNDIDIVLLDLMMPGMDGLEVLRTIHNDKEGYGEVPIIVLTNMTSEKVIKEAFELGAVSYLIKSELEYSDLVGEIKKILGSDK
ncbi:response regulator [Candidatus Dojkabacteria bacterium]|nr:response regulator [Candidatus Dojkabacteria bacterium]